MLAPGPGDSGPLRALMRASLSVIDFQTLNFYQNELTWSLGREEVPLPSGAVSWVQKPQQLLMEASPGREGGREGEVPGEAIGRSESAQWPPVSHQRWVDPGATDPAALQQHAVLPATREKMGDSSLESTPPLITLTSQCVPTSIAVPRPVSGYQVPESV